MNMVVLYNVWYCHLYNSDFNILISRYKEKIITLVMTLLCLLSSFVWLPSKVDATNTQSNQVVATQENGVISDQNKAKYNELIKILATKIAANGGLDRIDNLVLKRLVHEVFPLGEEQEMIIFSNIMHARMSSRFLPALIAAAEACVSNPVVCSEVASNTTAAITRVLGVVVGVGTGINWWMSHKGEWHFITENNSMKYCNGWGDGKRGWILLYSPHAHKNRFFNFNNNGVMERDYNWKLIRGYWRFSDGERGFETGESGYVMDRHNHSHKRWYNFNHNAICINP